MHGEIPYVNRTLEEFYQPKWDTATRDTAAFSQLTKYLHQRLIQPELVYSAEKLALLLVVTELGHSIDYWKQYIEI